VTELLLIAGSMVVGDGLTGVSTKLHLPLLTAETANFHYVPTCSALSCGLSRYEEVISIRYSKQANMFTLAIGFWKVALGNQNPSFTGRTRNRAMKNANQHT